MACAGGQREVVDYLIHCDPGICSDTVSALMNACSNGNVGIVSLLIVYATEKNLEHQNSHGNTCLMSACEKGNIDVIVILLDRLMEIIKKVCF